MTSKINCPRCGSGNLTQKSESLDAATQKVEATKQVCNDCNSRFYFEEQIIDYLKAISALIQPKQ